MSWWTLSTHISQDWRKVKQYLNIDHYREYISKVVVTDFDQPKDEVKKSVRGIKYTMPYTTFDEKHYSCFRNDLQKCIHVQFSNKIFEGSKS